jgi:HK97 gp10 family phage protein
MEQTGLKVQGLRQLTKAMQEIGIPKDAIKEAGKLAAQRVVNEAKTLVPVRSGKLRDSIRLGATASGKVTIRAGNNGTVPYANPIHWGWFKRHIKPQPFFAKALGYTRDEIYQTYFAQLEKHITEQTAKARIVND